ncbi:hypothetical protein ZWY2020_037865 [Hordeum vulgare]|nr:hypothetical protein ZWY2020_037865 [Hordeum vulgare]
MQPKASKGKEGRGVVPESELAKMRKKLVVFPPALDVKALRDQYLCMWARETKVHPATRVNPGSSSGGPDKFPFFADYFYYGLCPPFSDFFVDIMYTYGFQLLDFTSTVVTCMSVFAHLCENIAGVTPNIALFRHYFIPRIQKGDALSNSITWIPRTRNKEIYPDRVFHEKWEEWRAKWCWTQEEEPQPFCLPRKTKMARGSDWSALDCQDEKLTIAITRIQRLKVVGLTIDMVSVDFLRQRIAPLQNKGKSAWEFKNATDIMRLRRGLNNNLTVLQHTTLCHKLFRTDGKFKLPASIIPLCNNSTLNSIVAMMSVCNAHGLDNTWDEPVVE